jgi:APA family basic amino acid/polyamine antiporter
MELKRTVGVAGAVLLGLGSIIGTGVFVSIGVAADIAGPAVIAAVVIAALGRPVKQPARPSLRWR